MLHKLQKGADYVCDEVGSDTYVRKEESRGKTKHGSNFYAIAHSYRESKRLPRAIKSRLTTFLKTYSQQIIYRSQAEVLGNIYRVSPIKRPTRKIRPSLIFEDDFNVSPTLKISPS